MGLFDFLKPKKSALDEQFERMNATFFPKGERDIDAVTDAVLITLNNSISRADAKSIALKSVAISRISQNFDEERLRQHLAGYCLQYFNDKQVKMFHAYLVLLIAASTMYGKTPSEVVRRGDTWIIPK